MAEHGSCVIDGYMLQYLGLKFSLEAWDAHDGCLVPDGVQKIHADADPQTHANHQPLCPADHELRSPLALVGDEAEKPARFHESFDTGRSRFH